MWYNSGSNRARNFKSAWHFALVRFWNYSRDYSLNCTPLGPVTITNMMGARSRGCPITGIQFELFVIEYLWLDTRVTFTSIERLSTGFLCNVFYSFQTYEKCYRRFHSNEVLKRYYLRVVWMFSWRIRLCHFVSFQSKGKPPTLWECLLWYFDYNWVRGLRLSVCFNTFRTLITV